jgi:hypothetical protein
LRNGDGGFGDRQNVAWPGDAVDHSREEFDEVFALSHERRTHRNRNDTLGQPIAVHAQTFHAR